MLPLSSISVLILLFFTNILLFVWGFVVVWEAYEELRFFFFFFFFFFLQCVHIKFVSFSFCCCILDFYSICLFYVGMCISVCVCVCACVCVTVSNQL